MNLYKNPNLRISKSIKHGWGVFIDCDIKKDDLIEECNYIVASQKGILLDGRICNYLFDRIITIDEEDELSFVLPVGYCVSINSSTDKNVYFEWDNDLEIIRIKADRDIIKGEELYMSYGYN
jgi:hypothetical protein